MQAEYDAALAEYEDKDVPRPEHWGGFRVRVFEIEFWQGQKNRFHDRWVFRRADGSHEPADLSRARWRESRFASTPDPGSVSSGVLLKYSSCRQRYPEDRATTTGEAGGNALNEGLGSHEPVDFNSA